VPAHAARSIEVVWFSEGLGDRHAARRGPVRLATHGESPHQRVCLQAVCPPAQGAYCGRVSGSVGLLPTGTGGCQDDQSPPSRTGTRREEPALSDPSYDPAARAPGGGHAPSPHRLPPAASTRRVPPGPAPQPGYQAPPPEQPSEPQVRPLASGFPDYVSPPASPPNRTGPIVGTVVVVLLILFAAVGFLLVA
jgi:hypothetical protein